MTGTARTDGVIMRGLRGPARIAGDGARHALHVLKDPLHAPETSPGENGRFRSPLLWCVDHRRRNHDRRLARAGGCCRPPKGEGEKDRHGQKPGGRGAPPICEESFVSAEDIASFPLIFTPASSRPGIAQGRCWLASDACVPFITTILPEAAVSKADLGKAVDHLDAHEILGVLVAQLRPCCMDRPERASHPVLV